MVVEFILIFFRVGMTYTEYLCYLAMIASMFANAGFLSLFYPLSIFGYALLQETRPSKTYWFVVILYTGFVILLKFIS